MRRLRKIVGSKDQFRYITQVTDLLPLGKTESYDVDINCGDTDMRRLTGFAYEYYNPIHNKWELIPDFKYLAILNKHITSSVVIRKKKKKVIDVDSAFLLTMHFKERLMERFITDEKSTPGVLNYLVENGVILQGEAIFDQYLEPHQFYIYEPDMRMFVVAAIEKKKITLVTIYDPSDTNWFSYWLSNNDLKGREKLKTLILRREA